MPEDEFEIYLTLLAKTLRLSDAQRDAIAAELRDHMENRLRELMLQGIDRDDAIETALAEFGDTSALAKDLTRTNPATQRRKKHLMQTSFGTLIACASVTFAVMLLTPTNRDGQPNQTGVIAQDDPIDAVDGSDDSADAFGIADLSQDPFSDGADDPLSKDKFSIQVIDCTDILRPNHDRGDLLNRTAALANAVQQTVAAVNEYGDKSIHAQPFEEFIIVTATQSAHQEAGDLLNQISDRVNRRANIEEQQERDQHQTKLDSKIKQLTINIHDLEQVKNKLFGVRSKLKQVHDDPHHPDLEQNNDEIQAIKAKILALHEAKLNLQMEALEYR